MGTSVLDLYYCILLDYFSLNGYKKWKNNAKIFSIAKIIKVKKIYCFICCNYRKFENLKISYIFEKTLVLSIISSKCENEDEKTIKEEESIEIINILGLIRNT